MHRSVDIKLVLFVLFILLLLALYRPALGFLKPFINIVLEKRGGKGVIVQVWEN